MKKIDRAFIKKINEKIREEKEKGNLDTAVGAIVRRVNKPKKPTPGTPQKPGIINTNTIINNKDKKDININEKDKDNISPNISVTPNTPNMTNDKDKKNRFTKELIDKIVKVTEKEGFLCIICSECNIDRKTLYRWLQTHPSFATAFAHARAKLMKRYKKQMITAGKDKKNADWRVYKYLLTCLEEEFSEMKYKKDDKGSDKSGNTFIFMVNGEQAKSAKSEADKMLNDIPGVKQDGEIRLIE